MSHQSSSELQLVYMILTLSPVQPTLLRLQLSNTTGRLPLAFHS